MPGVQNGLVLTAAADGQNGLAAAAPIGTEPGAHSVPAWAGFRPLTVTKVVPETATVSSIYLAAGDGSALPAARPGQYLTLKVARAGDPAPVRSYSLSSAPGSGGGHRISVKHEPHGAASTHLNTSLRSGATLPTAAPRGEFTLAGGTGPVLLIPAPGQRAGSGRCL